MPVSQLPDWIPTLNMCGRPQLWDPAEQVHGLQMAEILILELI